MNIAGSALIGLSNIQDFTYYFGSLSILDLHILRTFYKILAEIAALLFILDMSFPYLHICIPDLSK